MREGDRQVDGETEAHRSTYTEREGGGVGGGREEGWRERQTDRQTDR